MRAAAGEAAPLAAGHELSVEANGPVLAEGWADDLHRMVLNLIENALRHTPAGTHVHAALRSDGDDAVLTVEDDGPGIPDELRPRLFERFVRGRGDSGGGSGLGLSIVHAVAVSHAGDVTIDHAPSGGARFVVRLPTASASTPDLAGPRSY